MAPTATPTKRAEPKDGAPDANAQARQRPEDVPAADAATAPDVMPADLVDALRARMDTVAQMQAEMTRFGVTRMRKALDARSRMMSCRSLPELQAVEADYMRDMVEDYAREWGRLWGYGLQVGLGYPVPVSAAFPERHATLV